MKECTKNKSRLGSDFSDGARIKLCLRGLSTLSEIPVTIPNANIILFSLIANTANQDAVAKDKDLRFTAEGGEGAGFSVGALLLFAAGGVSVAIADDAAGAIQGYLYGDSAVRDISALGVLGGKFKHLQAADAL